jgi:ankyrin repeat protein
MGQTPLHLAAIEGSDRIALMLIENGASFLKDKYGATPVDVAPYQRLRDVMTSPSNFFAVPTLRFTHLLCYIGAKKANQNKGGDE